MTFDEVLPGLLRVCDQSAAADHIEKWCAVRDLRGRVRLVVRPGIKPDMAATATLEQELATALGKYFAPPILTAASSDERGRLAQRVLERAASWTEPVYEDPVRGAVRARGNWAKLERRLSKIDWLERGAPRPPWTLRDPMPAIVTFYSFKGGVGRSTALAACAWQLASIGRRVAVIDLDLEAPGIGSLLGVETTRGVIDFVVDHLACGTTDLAGLSAPAQAFGADAERVQVFPAGRLTEGYLDKLARLDFAASSAWDTSDRPTSPTAEALRALIVAVGKQEPRPDYVLVDSRAGLHDLAGLSLHGLGHVDVLFSKASEQGYRGLELAVSLLAARRGPDFSCVVVQALAPTRATPEANEESREFRQRSYAFFAEHVYDEQHGYDGENTPNLDSTEDPHSPLILHFDAGLQRFLNLSDRRETLFGDDYVKLRGRIEELCELEADEEAPA